MLGPNSPSLSDYSLLRTYVRKAVSDYNLQDDSIGFAFFSLDQILNLQFDEIEDAQTDNYYLTNTRSGAGGHDRGIDAVYIDESTTPAIVHLFNFKYKMAFKPDPSHFPAGEIDKILGFLTALMGQEECLRDEINPVLFQKVKDIWDLFSTQNPSFEIHICTNGYLPFEEGEKKRFERDLSRFSQANVQYHLMPDYVQKLTSRGKLQVNGRVRIIDRNFFEKSDGDIRALVINVDVRDLLRIVIDDEEARFNVEPSDYSFLQSNQILEDSFEDNVRIYLRQRSKINRNIKETALSEDAHRFFYFNNGITITCKSFSYPNRRSPIVDLMDLQIVNGSQTIHALHEAFIDNPEKFDDMDILCRIYETQNIQLSTDIAEYTNSQNPVKSRDIRSNDYIQKKYEAEISAFGYFYERKKGQHSEEARAKRIDAEKAGQALMAFNNQMPGESKNDKRLIFADKYDDVYSDSITAEEIVFIYLLYDEIEKNKLFIKRQLLESGKNYEFNSFILHATYYILYVISELMKVKNLPVSLKDIGSAKALYQEAVDLIGKAVSEEMNEKKEAYAHRHFFKGSRPRKYLDDWIREKASQKASG